MTSLQIKPSTKPNKKLMAVFTRENGRKKTTHFGASGMDDYTITKNKEQRARYRKRHQKDLQTRDPMRAGFLSYYILWGESTSRQENIRKYKKRFNFK
jgi:hypothetical protein|tara:strand:- start:970 stop:1263 length:294 start_codon:yes stop_codon:yes gene_type:complete